MATPRKTPAATKAVTKKAAPEKAVTKTAKSAAPATRTRAAPRATATPRVTTAPRATNAARAATATRTPTATRNRTRRAARRVGIMGGTFDPIHHGHQVAASEVAGRFLLDEVVFVPTGQPWQKNVGEVSTAEDRYLMTVIATASNPRFHVSRVDVDRAGPTYTVDTLRELKESYGPKVELFFITGADALDKILSWKDSADLFQLAHFVGVTRPGFVLSAEHLPADSVSLVQVPAMAISSTDCRLRVHSGLPVWYLVPDGVVQYINKRGLYR